MRKDRAVMTILIVAALSLFAVGSGLLIVEPSLQVEWMQTHTVAGNSYMVGVKMTSDGGFVFAGRHDGSLFTTPGGSRHLGEFWLVKFDSYGNLVWNKTYPNANDSIGFSVDQTADGGYIVGGNMGVPPADSYLRFLLMKVDQYGNEEWTRTYPGRGDLYGWSSVQQTTDGGYIFTGGWDSVIKTYSNGSLQWSRSYSGAFQAGEAILQTSDGGYIIRGDAAYPVPELGSVGGGWILKIDASGNALWNRTFESVENTVSSIQQVSDGGYILSGTVGLRSSIASLQRGVLAPLGSWTPSKVQAWLLRLSSSGTTLWNKTFNAADLSEGMQTRQTSDGGYITSICAPWLGYGITDWLWRTDSNGTTLWYRPFASGTGIGCLQQTTDGDYVIAGCDSSVYAMIAKVSGAPQLFTPEVIPMIYVFSGGFFVTGAVAAIVMYLGSRRKHTRQNDTVLARS